MFIFLLLQVSSHIQPSFWSPKHLFHPNLIRPSSCFLNQATPSSQARIFRSKQIIGAMSDVVKVSRNELVRNLTCPLCGKILEEATGTGVCLDTFCRKCISQKIEDGADCCPVCRTELGSAPLEKLRPDQAKQNIRNLLFPLQSDKPKGRKVGSSSRAQGNSAQRVDKPKNTQHGNGTGQVRFILLASQNKEGNSLPQISSGSLRLEDGHLPVPYFQKYLKKKLNLKSETEVEITIDDQLLSPTLPVSSLIDQWQQKKSLSYPTQKSEGFFSGKVDITLHYRPSHLQE